MSNELDVEKLIEAIRVRPPLWNKAHPKYRTLEYTSSLWKEVRKELGCNLADAELKQKWHNLRDCFRRELRYERAGKKKRRWIYYSQMLFLLTPQYLHKFMRRRKSIEAGKTQVDEAEKTENVIPIKTETTDESCELVSNNTDSNNSELMENKKVCSENGGESTEDDLSDEQCLTEPMAEGLVIPDISEGEPSGYCSDPSGGDCGKHSRTIKDDDYHFAMSIIPHMRQVPLPRKLKMRIKITEIIAEEYDHNKAPS